MKRLPAIIILSLFIFSCAKKETAAEALLGSWKMKDVVNNTGGDFSEKTIFYKDSVITEIWFNGKIDQQFKSTYALNENTNILTITQGCALFEHKIVKLTGDELHLKAIKDGKTLRFVKL